MKGYKILCTKNTERGFIQEVLGKDSIWYTASNNCLFKTLSEAREFFKTSKHALRASSIWIEGPKGGLHGLFNRK